MFKYIKMKKREIELKLMLYTYILAFMKDKDSIIKMTISLVNELDNTPTNDIKTAFINRIAELVHEQKEKERAGELVRK